MAAARVGLGVIAIGAAATVASGVSYASIPARSGPVHKSASASPIVAMASTPDGKGYWFATAKGHIYRYGDAKFLGSVKTAPASPIVAMSRTPLGTGYWLVTAKGSVFTYKAKSYGSLSKAPGSPVVAMASTPDGKGYWIVTAKGHIYHYGDAKNWGSVT